MEIKKSIEANIDNSRYALVFIGLLFISSLILISFSYKAEQIIEDGNGGIARSADAPIQEEVVETPPEQPETPPQVEVPVPVQEDIVEEENTETEPVVVVTPPPPPIPKGPEQTAPKKEIIDFPDVEAQFPGGAAALQQWIVDNVNYPQTSIEMNEQGRVYLSFVVGPDGSISEVKVIKGVSADLDREAKRLVRSMPKWVSGEAAGEKVWTRCQIPINFTLN